MGSRAKANRPIDVLLLGGVLMAGLGACGILALMAWQAPEMIRAAYQPTAQWTATRQRPPTSTYRATATQTLTPSPILLPTHTPKPPATATNVPAATPLPSPTTPGAPIKWIEVDISEQTLTAYEGEIPVLNVSVSTGTARTPTPLGEFAIYARVPIQDMGGPDYLLKDVLYVAYFHGDYALHATYWHDNFGQPMSHGCINMRTADARWLYEWAPIGTPVRVNE
jgi:lipoprotein-anchoring transpeptidase ErfK/SrfK